PGEIIGINRNNPNGYMRFNTDGLGFSRDGGKTYRSAITYEGIVADAVTAGTLRGIVIEGVDIFGGTLQSLNNTNTFWNLETGKMQLESANFEMAGGAKIVFKDPRNNLTYTFGGRTSGIGFGNSVGNKAIVFIGHTRSSDPFAARDSSNFRG